MMTKIKAALRHKDVQSVLLVVGGIAGLIAANQLFSTGQYVSYSLGPISAIGYFISYRSNWRGVVMAILANIIMTFYVLALEPQSFEMTRATVGLLSNAIGYSLIGWQSENLILEKTRSQFLGQVQLARFRAAFEEAEGHILRAMTLIELRKSSIEDEANFILTELKRAQSLISNQVTIAEVARQLVEDKEKLGFINGKK